jgi:hypothetical protein
VSDTEFKPKPLTAAQQLKMNLCIALGLVVVFAGGFALFHFHTEPASSYATAPTPASPKL